VSHRVVLSKHCISIRKDIEIGHVAAIDHIVKFPVLKDDDGNMREVGDKRKGR
jgi:hypothetical protein